MAASPLQGSRHSQASASPGASQTADHHHDHDHLHDRDLDLSLDLPLDTLVAHLLAAKRALAAISTVWRANELVTAARAALEQSVGLDARTAFVRRGIVRQARLLRRLRRALDHVYRDGQRDFQDLIRALDAADLRLQKTMDLLRATRVLPALRPRGEEPKSLLDFVDEAAVEAMRMALKDSIDQTQDAQAEFLDAIQAYDTDIKSMRATMTAAPPHEAESPIPHLLRSLEDNAAEMANLLDSLVQHFDLCVNALRHTEGGFAAVKQAATNNELPDGVTVSGVIQEQGPDSGLLEPLSDADRREMLAVLANDAAEVEDVVLELHQRLASMGEAHEQIQEHASVLGAAYHATLAAFTLLEATGTRLPAYIASSHEFLLRWGESKVQIGEQMEELESVRVFYEGYLTSYHGLLDEVGRRTAMEDKVKVVLRKAMEQVRKLHDADTREREGFRREVGDFLPSDLWPGLVANPPRWEVRVMSDEEDAEAENSVAEAQHPAQDATRTGKATQTQR